MLATLFHGLAAPLAAAMLLAPGAPSPEAVPDGLDYGGRIERIWTDHDVWVDGEKGIRINVTFRTTGLRGWPCRAVAYFRFDDGVELEDFDGVYTTVGGQVSASTTFTPLYENTRFTGLQIFIPYEQLHLDSGRYDLQVHVELYSESHGRHFAQSEPVRFWYSNG